MGAVLQQSRQREAVWDEHARPLPDAIAAGDAATALRLTHRTARPAAGQQPRRPAAASPQSNKENLHETHKEQHEQFDRDGYLFFPGLFTPDETRT
jgi:hypothetical protein